ncbi:MAG: biopolymer transporter ExbD [Myxococcota bacterium]|nr:biopolymer transporter ExbD [Myxococcota bacterium]
MNFRRSRREAARVDVTPLIDIIFQLVLFFMVSTTFVTSPGIEVDLPRSSAETILQEQEDLHVWMTDAGSVYVDKSPVDFEGLRQVFEKRALKDPSTLVIIEADTNVDHGQVVGVMDLARSVGLERLAIATEPEFETGQEPSETTP